MLAVTASYKEEGMSFEQWGWLAEEIIARTVDNSSEKVVNEIKTAFLFEGKRKGSDIEWAPTTIKALLARKNKPTWEQIKARSWHTLVDTGAYKESMHQEMTREGGNMQFYIGSDKPYARTHELGGAIKVGKRRFDVPPRKVQYLTERNVTNLRDALAKDLGANG